MKELTFSTIVDFHLLGHKELPGYLPALRRLWDMCGVATPGFDPKSTTYQVFVAEVRSAAGELAGVGCLVNSRGPGWSMRADAVAPPYRNRGIHKQLIRMRQAHALGRCKTGLVVCRAAVAAVVPTHNYVGLGFRDVGKVVVHFGKPYHELVWSQTK